MGARRILIESGAPSNTVVSTTPPGVADAIPRFVGTSSQIEETTCFINSTTEQFLASSTPNGFASSPHYSFVSDSDTGFSLNAVGVLDVVVAGVRRMTFSTTEVGTTYPIQASAGTAAAPSHSFTVDINTGIYRVAADQLGITTGGVLRFDVSTSAITSTLQFSNAIGSVTAPAYSFTGDLDTGMYRRAADSIGFSCGGAARGFFSTTAFTTTVQNLTANGTLAAPSYSFSNDTGSGLYLNAVGDMRLAVGGVDVAALTSTAWGTFVQQQNVAGLSVAAPDYSFFGDSDTGMYLVTANSLGFATAGVQRMRMTTVAMISSIPHRNAVGSTTAPAFSFDGDANTGVYQNGADVLAFTAGGTTTLQIGNNTIGMHGATPVARPTYGAPTGTINRGSIDESTATLAQAVQLLNAVVTDLRLRGDFA